ncbi:MAG: DUF1801 domain-containing protein [Bacteroidia bacterium]
MQSKAISPKQYIEELPDDRKGPIMRLRNAILENLPEGFTEEMSYGMLGYVVPHSMYRAGYHCDPSLPLPFMSIASQKNFVALYHMGIYAQPALLQWFQQEYPKHSKTRLDMGKSCIRFKQPDQIPFSLVAELAGKMSAEEWIALYERNVKR